MSATSAGYDMICSLTQDSINAGFQKLSNTGFIDAVLKSNGISVSAISGNASVSSYLRAGVMPPVLSFADGLPSDRALLKFRFYKIPFDRSGLGTPVATWVNGNDTIYTYHEPLKVRDSSGNPTQLATNVYYWIRLIGNQEYLVPSFRYFMGDQEVLVNVDEMRIVFAVALNKLRLDAATVNTMVAQGDLPPEVSVALKQVYFNSNEFSVQHLFVDLDHDNIASLQLIVPTTDSVTACSVVTQQTVQIPKSELTPGGKFYLEFQSNLEYTFGLGQKNQFGSTPYLLGFQGAIQSNFPLPPNAPQLLYPTYIGYSGTYNRNQPNLSTLNFQVLGGSNPTPPSSGGVINSFHHNIVTDPGNTGALLLAAEAFFNPLILYPIQSTVALPDGGRWGQNGNRFSYNANSTRVIEQHEDVTAGMGSKTLTTEYLSGSHSIIVQKPSQIIIQGSLNIKITITVTIVDWLKDFDCTWEKSAVLNYVHNIGVVVDDQQQIAFEVLQNDTSVNVSAVTTDAGGSFMDAMSSIFNALSASHFDTIENVVDQIANGALNRLQDWSNNVNDNLNTQFQAFFISPLGQQYQVLNPRFDDEFNFMLDLYQPGLFPVGYRVGAPGNPNQLRSLIGDNTAKFVLLNNGPVNMAVDWVNYSGVNTPNFTLPKGGGYSLQTYLTHPFIVKSEQPLFLFEATAPLDEASSQTINVGDGYVAIPTSEDKKVKSSASDIPSKVTFFNATGYTIYVYWIDYTGKRQQYVVLTNNNAAAFNTGTLQFWSVYDAFDNCIGLYYITTAGPMTINLGKVSMTGV